MNPDIQIDVYGIALITALTDAGREWVDENVNYEPWQLQGNAVACERSYADGIADGARDDGLEVVTA